MFWYSWYILIYALYYPVSTQMILPLASGRFSPNSGNYVVTSVHGAWHSPALLDSSSAIAHDRVEGGSVFCSCHVMLLQFLVCLKLKYLYTMCSSDMPSYFPSAYKMFCLTMPCLS